MRKLALLAMALLLGLSLTACTKADPNAGEPNGEVGKTYETKWFEFSVDAIEKTPSYKGIDAAEGSTFLVCTVTETNNWKEKESLPMSAEDFYVNREGWDDVVWPETSWDEAMMPLSFDLAPEETVTYDVVFTVPADTADIQLVYVEINESGDKLATFTINHEL